MSETPQPTPPAEPDYEAIAMKLSPELENKKDIFLDEIVIIDIVQGFLKRIRSNPEALAMLGFYPKNLHDYQIYQWRTVEKELEGHNRLVNYKERLELEIAALRSRVKELEEAGKTLLNSRNSDNATEWQNAIDTLIKLLAERKEGASHE